MNINSVKLIQFNAYFSSSLALSTPFQFLCFLWKFNVKTVILNSLIQLLDTQKHMFLQGKSQVFYFLINDN